MPTFSLLHIWTQGDWVTRSTLSALLFMSILSWTILVLKAYHLWRHQRTEPEQNWQNIIHDKTVDTGNLFFRLTQLCKTAAQKLPEQISFDKSHWLMQYLQQEIAHYAQHSQRGLAVLSSIAATAPFIGLFGTVWGIHRALLQLGNAPQISMHIIAGPLGETLMMTALGLAVAIPAVLGFNSLLSGYRHFFARLQNFAHELHVYHITGTQLYFSREN